MDENETVEPRVKRQKQDKHGRFAALKKLKDLKGSKHKCEIEDVDNVYDTVDELEYTKRVIGRQEDDWIVDDDGCGYVEDGRDVFDDDLDSESIALASASKGKGSKRKKKAVSENAGKGNLQFMLSNMPAKKKEAVNLDEDDVLSELISEIDNPSSSTTTVKPKVVSRFSLIEEKRAVKDYMKSFAVAKPKIKKEEINKTITEEVKEDVEVLKEIHENGAESGEKEVVEVKKSKLLFKIEEKPKIIEDIKIENVSQDELDLDNTEQYFDDDFDFSQIEDADVSSKPETAKKAEDDDAFAKEFQFGDSSDILEEFSVDMSEVPQSSVDADKSVFRFFWWDAYEDGKNQPGTVLLFGKTFSEEEKKFVSCCVVVRNIERELYLLPRPYELNEAFEVTKKAVTFTDVYNEFTQEMSNCGQVSTYKCKKVTKHYAFDPAVPKESEYLLVKYSGPLDFLEKKYRTFSRVFGANRPFLEIFLLDRKIKGPCWLSVSNPEFSKNPWTYSKVEVVCEKTSNVSVIQTSKPLPPPPLVVLALNVKLAVDRRGENQIAMISCLTNTRYALDKQAPNPPFQEHFCVFAKLKDEPLPMNTHVALTKYKATKVQKLDSERALLNYFLTQYSKIDPDLVVGHDLTGYQLTVLGDRLLKSQATNISRLSKIRRPNSSFNKFRLEKSLFSGRLVCDIMVSAKELIKSRSYDLESLCQYILKIADGQRIEIEPETVSTMYQNTTDLFKMISLTMQDTAYILKIMYELNVIPLALQITNIAGNVMSRTLMGGRSERNEFLLLHAFSEKDFIVPEKNFQKKTAETDSKRKKPTYSGGLVLDPKVGFYDKLILLMDFNSLYPSIIQEYNICFTTITAEEEEEITLPDKNLPPGILPTEIRKLVESRREVKKLMKNPELSQELQMQYNIRQTALKLTANSMYGCLGFSNSRFFAKKLAALVTQKGREILTNTRDLVQRMNYDVIYGDTDSIMINTDIIDYEQVFKIGKNIKQEINKMYKQVELDIDGVFKYLLLLKKKKYAAVSLTKTRNGKLQEVQEHKGLDIVRRDWSQLAAEAGKHVLNQILSDQSPDERLENIHSYLRKLKEEIEAHKVPLQLLIITKQLTKDPSLYTDKNSLPHVQAALRNNKNKAKKFKAGDTVPYVICEDGSKNSATQRSYLLEELSSNKELKIDTKYYLTQQIHPVISRICEPIEGTDAYQIAECLGIEMTKKPIVESAGRVYFEDIKKFEIKFRNAKPFTFPCLSCKTQITLNQPPSSKSYLLDICPNIDCVVRPVEYVPYIKNKLVLAMRNFIQLYYLNEMTCEDPGCPNNTVRVPQRFVTKFPVCTLCEKGVMYRLYTEHDLYSQILFYQHLFDITNIDKKNIDIQLESGYNGLRETVENVLKNSGFCRINLDELFSGLVRGKYTEQVEYQLDLDYFDDE